MGKRLKDEDEIKCLCLVNKVYFRSLLDYYVQICCVTSTANFNLILFQAAIKQQIFTY